MSMQRVQNILGWHLALVVFLFVSLTLIMLYVAAFGAEGTWGRHAASPIPNRLQEFRIEDLDARLKAVEKTVADRIADVWLVAEHGRRIEKLETVGLGILIAAAGGFGNTALGILSVRKHVRKNGG